MATKNETRIHRNYKRTGYEKHNILFSRQQINQKNYVEETKRKEKGETKERERKKCENEAEWILKDERKVPRKKNRQKTKQTKTNRKESRPP